MTTGGSDSGDEILLGSSQKDVNEFFEKEKAFLMEYNKHLQDASIKADKVTFAQKAIAENYIKISSSILNIASADSTKLEAFLTKLGDTIEQLRKMDTGLASDQDLILTDCLKYHSADTTAAKDLLFRRLR